MRWALEDAGLPAEAVEYINAHGTSTPANDAVETQAIKAVFGDHAAQHPDLLHQIHDRPRHGRLRRHRSGGVRPDARTAAIIHPTINYEFPDPECDLDYVPNRRADRAACAWLSPIRSAWAAKTPACS